MGTSRKCSEFKSRWWSNEACFQNCQQEDDVTTPENTTTGSLEEKILPHSPKRNASTPCPQHQNSKCLHARGFADRHFTSSPSRELDAPPATTRPPSASPTRETRHGTSSKTYAKPHENAWSKTYPNESRSSSITSP